MSTSNYHLYAFDDIHGSFSVNSQRPPVPGEENDKSQKNYDKSVLKKNTESCILRNPAPGIPRRLTHEVSGKNFVDPKVVASKLDQCDSNDAPLGFEPEGSTSLSSIFQESSNSSGTPSYLRWAENFNYLLQDSDGVKLFKEFLDDQEENCGTLDFWFACSGLKMVAPTESDRISGLVKLIYKKYIKGNNLRLKLEVKKRIIDRLKRERIDQTIFNEAQVEIENVMRNDMYPLFLKSDIYLQFVQAGGESPKPSHSSSTSEGILPGSGIGKLPTLHEEEELKSDTLQDNASEDALRYLTQGTPRVRDGLNPDRYLGISYPGFRSRLTNPYHVSYAPVSAQDSELQSLSSDALTDDTMSYTDSSVDGREYAVHRNKMALRKQAKVMRRNADTNQYTGLNQQFIPRTQVVKPDCNLAEKDPAKFASLLIERLLKVKEELDKQERFLTSMRSIQETDDESGGLSTSQHRSSLQKSGTAFNSCSVGSFPFTSMLFASAIATNNCDPEDNAQSILDDHVSHIWNSSGVTPSRSPGRLTPDHARRDAGLLVHSVGSSVPKSRSRETSVPPQSSSKEGKFMHPTSLSAGGGGKHYQNPQHSGKEHRSISAKELEPSSQSRHHSSTPGPGSSQPGQARSASVLQPWSGAEDPRQAMGRQNALNPEAGDVARTGKAENSSTDRHIIPPTETTNERVLMWMLDNEKYCETRAHCSTDCSDKGSSNKRSSHKSAGKKGSNHKTNRSESLDRTKLGAVPASGNQLNGDGKRPSTDDTKMASNKTGWLGKLKGLGDTNDAKKQDFTIVGYYFCDEPIPYRTTILGRNVTLGHLKQLIAKKGNYRYFFKKVCNEFESGVVHEEITNDDDVLPLWDGKVVCKVERLV